MSDTTAVKKKAGRITRHNKYGYIFLIPFMAAFVVFQMIPLVSTVFNSFFENYKSGLKQIGPNFVGFGNYIKLISSGDLLKYFGNTMIMWILGFIPQIVVSLLLSAWFTDPSLRLKGLTLFGDNGPVNSILVQAGIFAKPYSFMSHIGSVRGLVAFMNFLMWFGNTTILLMAGMMGIDQSLFEAAEVDGASANQIFFRITLPLLKPILIYVMITSLIGGLQMFDVPQILTNGSGDPMRSSMTLIMYLNKHLFSKNYGMAGALSVILLIITGILSMVVFRFTAADEVGGRRKNK